MPEINAKMVNELRAKTGLPMMECKKLLTETGGDIEKAIDLARKRGVKTSITERAATEGRVAAEISADKKRGWSLRSSSAIPISPRRAIRC